MLRNAWRRAQRRIQRRRERKSVPETARRLYDRMSKPYDVRLDAASASAREAVLRTAKSVCGSEWNYYSDALRPEIVEGFARTVAAAPSPCAYLEIGSCQGVSMSIVARLLDEAGKVGPRVSVDPYLDSGYTEGARSPWRLPLRVVIGADARLRAEAMYRLLGIDVEILQAMSVDGLRRLLVDGRRFDLAYIDGCHEGLAPVADLGLVMALLAPGGLVVLDDHLWPDVEPIKRLLDLHAEPVQETWKTATYRLG